MRDLTETLDRAFEAIDAANNQDPNRIEESPLALVQGQRASLWVDRLTPDASPALRVAARAHHLRRWEVARTDYPADRRGYLRWRRDNKAHQAESAAAILAGVGWSEVETARVRELLLRAQLRTDAETQALEDVACLVFLETQFDPMVARIDHGHMVTIVASTLTKMSSDAIAVAGTLRLGPEGQAIIDEAAQALEAKDRD